PPRAPSAPRRREGIDGDRARGAVRHVPPSRLETPSGPGAGRPRPPDGLGEGAPLPDRGCAAPGCRRMDGALPTLLGAAARRARRVRRGGTMTSVDMLQVSRYIPASPERLF